MVSHNQSLNLQLLARAQESTVYRFISLGVYLICFLTIPTFSSTGGKDRRQSSLALGFQRFSVESWHWVTFAEVQSKNVTAPFEKLGPNLSQEEINVGLA